MKNDLTSEEWLILTEYLLLAEFAFAVWDQEGNFNKNLETLKKAKSKFYEVGFEIYEKEKGFKNDKQTNTRRA